jgi:3',5'-cyclic AMP phosphodiesterase CpdA
MRATAILGVALLVSAAAAPAVAAADPDDTSAFRVEPYLQNPSDEGVTITWFSEEPAPGRLTVRGPGAGSSAVHTSTPTYVEELDYTDAELAERIDGLPQGSWLRGPANYKHVVEVDGLRADKRYRYTVEQGGERFTERFRTAPRSDAWRSVRFVALSDAETEPRGRVLRREWAPGAIPDGGLERPSAEPGGTWDQHFGTTVLSQVRTLRYLLTEDEGYERNLAVIESRDPDLVVMPGDLVQGGGYQPGWDEFFRHNAGETGNVLSRRPIVPALGNWENFGALNGGYGTPEDRSPVVRARAKYRAYFDPPANDTPEHDGTYHRIDYGPVTFITLDSSNGEPDDAPSNYASDEKATGQEYNGPGTDTQSNYTREEYEAAGGTDVADINPGSAQWEWAERELADARAAGQIVFVQFHHAPFSSGEHGVPMDHELTSGQGGTPMRQYHEMFEEHGVAAVLSGHSEMFERSFVDLDGDGVGVHYYDVGVAGDGLRGERRDGTRLDDPLLRYNPYRAWTADQDEPEVWEDVDGVRTLVAGGKHYGHLEVDVERLDPPGRNGQGPSRGGPAARITFTPAYVFPVMDATHSVARTERRVYDDEVVLHLDHDGVVMPE